jgi:glycogen synthase
VLYSDPALFQHFRLNGMQADFSWDKSAAQYLQFYRELTRARAGG